MDNTNEKKTKRKEKNIKEILEFEQNLSIDEIVDKVNVVGILIGKILYDEKGGPYDFIILKVNSVFEQIVGSRKEEVVGKTGLKVFSNIKESWFDLFINNAKEGKSLEFDFFHEPLNKFFKISVSVFSEEIFFVLFTDITEIKKQKVTLEKTYELQKAMNMIRSILIESEDENTLYQKVCDILTQVSFIKISGIFLIVDKNSPMNIAAFSAPDKFKDYITKNVKVYLKPTKGTGTFITALETGEPVVVDNTLKDERVSFYREYYSELNIKSLITLPLIYENQQLGVVSLFSDQEGAFGTEEAQMLKELSADISMGIHTIRLKKDLIEKNKNLEKAINGILIILSKILVSKDPYTADHQRRVAQLSVAIAKKLGLPKEKVKLVELGALVHDAGKITIPIEILVKPGKLTEKEFEIVKDLPQKGYELLKDLISPFDILAQIALQHHERLDGSGYPQGLKDEEILFEAKIIAVADVVEAMSSHRPYRPALGIDKALEEISTNKGKLFDPEVVDACIKVIKEDGFKFD